MALTLIADGADRWVGTNERTGGKRLNASLLLNTARNNAHLARERFTVFALARDEIYTATFYAFYLLPYAVTSRRVASDGCTFISISLCISFRGTRNFG